MCTQQLYQPGDLETAEMLLTGLEAGDAKVLPGPVFSDCQESDL